MTSATYVCETRGGFKERLQVAPNVNCFVERHRIVSDIRANFYTWKCAFSDFSDNDGVSFRWAIIVHLLLWDNDTLYVWQVTKASY